MNIARNLVKLATRFIPVLLLLAVLIPNGSAQAPAPNPSWPEGAKQPPTDGPLLGPAANGAAIFYVTGLEFTPFTPTTAYTHIGVGVANTSTTIAYFDGPIYLPHGARITQFVVYFIDNDTTTDIDAYLGYQNYTGQYATAVVILTSSGASSAVRYMSTPLTSDNTVDLVNRGWLTWVGLPANPNTYLIGVRVDYAFDTMLPTILRQP